MLGNNHCLGCFLKPFGRLRGRFNTCIRIHIPKMDPDPASRGIRILIFLIRFRNPAKSHDIS
jgi:hypothetical protein